MVLLKNIGVALAKKGKISMMLNKVRKLVDSDHSINKIKEDIKNKSINKQNTKILRQSILIVNTRHK